MNLSPEGDDTPVIDWRHYLEEVLDMHNSHQSFLAPQRIINRMGDAGNQVIWFTDARPTAAVDACFETNGDLIESGDDVWNGR
ncbi:hypothetical protein FDP08_18990 [Marinobacter panjinensis]|uniref:DUF6351 domain-containing protein n=1 Tax=Marinobacter panjinensis TaxID=2576384 RepID=A0A4U6QW53_9GAMM|nr:DUF6351 family protein [Marinobacter panjinensis]MCR8915266.1 DUF6351 family protein [Marinobacter panjinensis]TKV64482.1 hypothetical protein FDP08_18990 [Marinobacter panjinensis]